MSLDIEQYLPRIEQFLGVHGDNLDIRPTDFGYAVIKGNWVPPQGAKLGIDDLILDLDNRVLHERVLVINGQIPIRSHQEESQEVVKNIGKNPITYQVPTTPFPLVYSIPPEDAIYTVNGGFGNLHGFDVEDVGLLYVAKALYPSYVKGNSFTVPLNTFKLD